MGETIAAGGSKTLFLGDRKDTLIRTPSLSVDQGVFRCNQIAQSAEEWQNNIISIKERPPEDKDSPTKSKVSTGGIYWRRLCE